MVLKINNTFLMDSNGFYVSSFIAVRFYSIFVFVTM